MHELNTRTLPTSPRSPQTPTTSSKIEIVPITDHRCLVYLTQFEKMTPTLLAGIIKEYKTWYEFAQSSPNQRASKIGPLAGLLPAQLPLTPPDIIVPRGINLCTAYDSYYPDELRGHQDVAPLLYVKGQFAPDFNKGISRTVAITGSKHPSRTGFAVAKIAARSAASYGLTPVIVLTQGVGEVAAVEALKWRSPVIAIVPAGLNRTYNAHLEEQILQTGGVILSTFHWAHIGTTRDFATAERLAVGMAPTVVAASGGVPFAQHASYASRYADEFSRHLIAPKPEDVSSTGIADLGVKMLTDQRFADAQTTRATVSVADPSELDDAIRAVAQRKTSKISAPAQRVTANRM